MQDYENCGHCRFWLAISGGMGECQCHAPRPGLAPPEGKPFSVRFPLTGAEEFCGEFQQSTTFEDL